MITRRRKASKTVLIRNVETDELEIVPPSKLCSRPLDPSCINTAPKTMVVLPSHAAGGYVGDIPATRFVYVPWGNEWRLFEIRPLLN